MRMLPPTVVVERRRGRPSVSKKRDVPAADVHLKLPIEDFDRGWQIAQQRNLTLQELLRRVLRRIIEDERGNTLAGNKKT